MVLAAAMSAESGISRPGVVSRCSAISSRVVQSSRTAARPRRPLRLVDAGRTSPRVLPRRRDVVDEVLELLLGPVVLARLDQRGGDHVAQLEQHLDVEGGVLQPRLRQRPARPVDRGVLLAHRAARGSPRPGWPGRRAGSPSRRAASSVSKSRTRHQPDLAQAGEVLAGGVQDPLGVADRLVERGQVVEGDRVDQRGAGPLATQLDQVGARGVAVARGPLGVERDRAGARARRRSTTSARRGVGLGDRRAARRAGSAGDGRAAPPARAEVASRCRWSRGRRWALADRLGPDISRHVVRVGRASWPRPRARAAARPRCRAARPRPRRGG